MAWQSPAGFILCPPLLPLCYTHHSCQQAQPSSEPSLRRINLGNKQTKAKAYPKQSARAKHTHVKPQLSSLLQYMRELSLLETLGSSHPSNTSDPKPLHQVSRESWISSPKHSIFCHRLALFRHKPRCEPQKTSP